MHHLVCFHKWCGGIGMARYMLLVPLLFIPPSACAMEFSITVADIVAPAFYARGIRLALPADGSADLRIADLQARQHKFQDVHIRCASFKLSSAQISCGNGKLDAIPGAMLEFSYGFATRRLQLAFSAADGELWKMDGRFGERTWQVSAQLRDAQVKRFADFIPADLPTPAQGTLNGKLHISGNTSGLDMLNADVQLVDMGFSDTSGLHAAEKLRGSIRFNATRKASLWTWQSDIAWRSGEVFWQPLYLRGGHRLSASGSFDGAQLKVEQAVADLPGVGRVQFSVLWDAKQKTLSEATARGDNLALGNLFSGYAKPFLGKGALTESALYGRTDVDWQYRSGATQSLRLVLHDVGIADASQRFALLGVNGNVDWQADASRTASIAFAGGTLLGVPLGAGQWTVQMHGMEFSAPQAVLPIMDGRLDLRDFYLHRMDNAWRWQFSASLSQVSMEQFSQAAGWPKMHGTLAGRIPEVSYDGDEINVGGALLFDVFDGTVVATQLKLANAFGHAPRLSGNLSMRELDLDLLTRTFSFGNMQGRIDVDVNNLQLQDWQPVRFDARISSSAGRYPKKISQKAVQNISALGGGGAAAAIQRSYLRFFENFGYERIGWSCALRNGVCEMGGLDDDNGAGYQIIKGGGIPAISVMGYNRNVGWNELLTRLNRVTQNNVKPVVK